MVHVFVSSGERKSVAMPEAMRKGLEKLLVAEPAKL
jgi:acyl-CoA thioesterase FadM